MATDAQPEPAAGPAEKRMADVPQPGDLTRGWGIATLALWTLVALALAAVWGTSAQLGLATWWLGPRGERNPVFIRFLPFFPSIFMLVRTLLGKRWDALYGVIAGVIIVVIGVFDFSHVTGLAWLEIVIGGAAIVGSIASLSGTYRRARN